ncbi:hypothetical protein ABTM44_18090, partial [Acinetobacter baumannii]
PNLEFVETCNATFNGCLQGPLRLQQIRQTDESDRRASNGGTPSTATLDNTAELFQAESTLGLRARNPARSLSR